jgi:hypothetical protein
VKLARRTFGIASVVGVAGLVHTCGSPDEPGPAAAPPLVPEETPDETLPETGPDDPPTARRELLDDLRWARDLARHASDAQGRAWLEPTSSAATVGQSGRWSVVYEAGASGIAVGGCVRLTVPSQWWNWSEAQAEVEEAPGYTTAESLAEGVTLTLRPDPQGLEWVIGGRALAAGEQVRIVYGAGPAGARADRYAERDSKLWIGVDGDGDGISHLLTDSPGVDVAPGPADILSAVLPSTAEPGTKIALRLAFLDRAGSRGAAYAGKVQLIAQPEGLELPAEVEFTPADGGVKKVELGVTKSGVFRLIARAADEGGEFVAQANPLVVDAKVAHVRWGDFHGHSNLSDGTGTPEDFLAYARDIAGLDAVCLTDHDHWGMLALDEYPELWERIRATTREFHVPGDFVTLLGYEWTSWIHGHRHVLYFGDEGPVLSSIDERYETPAQLWDGLEGLPAMTFAHHSAGGPIATNWDFAPPPELEPVTEVASVHGSSEAPDAPARIYDPLRGNFVRDALGRGHRLGFIGSNDSHDGHPGLAHLVNPQRGGLAALLTDDLTREGIRAALMERRCYATNGPRIVLRVALDGARMGSDVAPKAGKSLLYVRAIACAPIRSIELVRAGQVAASIAGEGHWDIETAFEPADLAAGEYLYVRVVQEDEGAAWSSPFYVR